MNDHISATYDKKQKCSMCENEFTSKKLRSRFIRPDKIENDFYTIYKEPLNNPILYEVYVCPKCGFACTEQFKTNFTDKLKGEFFNKVTRQWNGRNYNGERTYEDAIQTYKLALISAEVTNQPPVVIGGICLRLSWLYRYLQNVEEEQRFSSFALKKYEKSFMEGDFKETSMSELKLLFLLGELSRKADLKEGALKFFSKVVEHKERHFEPQLVEKAREQWYEMRKDT
ncbi:DUF2225 domain-containing protein [Evansella sp. AB-P1]|uniref:DUF2225 domain-containing protein n=1 Tax=Evansella sp. AB-P1 TaxID=3037653 RepID=UPI00241DBBD9|nr:DUF2225 domain-containing protein [Evansella sp. AB-P1]MDG5786298.1 DUF2225 domain-containing protein [Evansella sp. AB-P1]